MKKPLTDEDGNVRELSLDDIRQFKPARNILPSEFFDGMQRLRGQRGPQKAPKKELISLRVDADILSWFKEGGAGYQARMNDVLRNAMEQQPKS